MNRRQVQKRLIASENLWFGTSRASRRVWGTVTRHHADPEVDEIQQGDQVESPGVDQYEIELDTTTGDWSIRPSTVE